MLSAGAQEALNLAANEAVRLNFDYIGTEHLILGLSREPIGSRILMDLGVNLDDLRKEVEDLIGRGKGAAEKEIPLNPRSKRALELALEEARSAGERFIGSEHLLLGLIREDEGIAAQVLKRRGIDLRRARQEITNMVGRGEMPPAASAIPRKSKTPTLDQYSRDLTQLASEGKLDPVIGREKEIERIIRILSRRTKNNPALIGEAGVGKTAIAEGLAQKIMAGEVPDILKNKRVVALDLAGMVAGTRYRGEFEERLKRVMDEIRERGGEIIIFIDELHTIAGAGAAEGAIDASNMLKPALTRGEMQVVGATTLDEYRKHIEKDSALERRFQPIMVGEPTVEDTIEILKGLRDRYEAHHRVAISDDAIVAAAELSDMYITDRFLPDKAIDLVDEAGAKVRLQSTVPPVDVRGIEERLEVIQREKEAAVKAEDYEKAMRLREKEQEIKEELEKAERDWARARGMADAVVTTEDIAEIVSGWTGVPATKLVEEEKTRLLKMEESLHKRVIGQEEAIEAVSEAIRRARAGLKDPNRPIGSFIFLGPTGVGKTELARALAEHLFGDEEAMIRIDMSEYMEKHTVSRLIGAPPGYVGYEEAGQLTEPVRRRPYSVVLFDEVEKAHPDVLNILLQIMDDGRITDAKGRTVNFKNTVIIMTSNIGSHLIKQASTIGFKVVIEEAKRFESIKEQVLRELEKSFRPEFLNRVDEIIVFHPLTSEQIRKIVDILMLRVERELKAQQIALELSDAAKDMLAKEGFDPLLGARPLRRTIQRRIENPLASKLLRGEFSEGDTVIVDAEDDKIIFRKTGAAMPEAADGASTTGGTGGSNPEEAADEADGGMLEA
ncbi:MAG: ATP-dependent Clp protease ATP-binding subunit [Actinobacteria bacterium]|nr:ATP-dependent Clp protease ATP-binding subunit [Actinomycetota bacterium]